MYARNFLVCILRNYVRK